ncbi:MAG TPA: hypothetical protein VFE03_09260 [Caulobacteraceae bacterium]|nr:hypothetical protein [Caulobacteraceae bacterium]
MALKPPPSAAPPRAPIALQLMGLVLAGLLVGQVMTFVVVILLPPPRVTVYHLGEVAEALQGGPLKFRDGRTLIRRIQAAPPRMDPRHMHGLMLQRILAAMMRLPAAQVRIAESGPMVLFRFDHRGPPPGHRRPTEPGCSAVSSSSEARRSARRRRQGSRRGSRPRSASGRSPIAPR